MIKNGAERQNERPGENESGKEGNAVCQARLVERSNTEAKMRITRTSYITLGVAFAILVTVVGAAVAITKDSGTLHAEMVTSVERDRQLDRRISRLEERIKDFSSNQRVIRETVIRMDENLKTLLRKEP